MGIVTTMMHIGFVALHVGAGLWRTPGLVTGPGAVFRLVSGITLATGIVLHVSSLPLGPEVFQQNVLTPVVDTVFAIPMTIAGILPGCCCGGAPILPALWEKVAYGFVVLFPSAAAS